MRRLRFKRFATTAGTLLFVFFGVIVAAPMWVPWAAPIILAHYHIHYRTYDRLGYTHFVVKDAVYQYADTTVHADRIEGLEPTVWLWEKFIARKPYQEAFATVNQWQVDVASSNSKSPMPVYERIAIAREIVKQARRWVPRATLHNGVVQFDRVEIRAPSAQWDHGHLTAAVANSRIKQTGELEGDFGSNWVASVKLLPSQVEAKITIQQTTAILQTDISLRWRTNQAGLSAEFARQGLLPERTAVAAKSIRFPLQQIGLKNYQDLTGSLSALWQNGKFQLDLAATAQPLNATNLLTPPLTIRLQAGGDTNSLRIDSAEVSLPGLKAGLTHGFELTYHGRMLSESAALNFSADISKQPWLPLSGQIAGKILLNREPVGFPKAAFDLSGENLAGFGIDFAHCQLHGDLNWPALEIDRLNLALSNGAAIHATAQTDLQARTIQRGTITAQGAIARNLLPEDFDYETLSLSAKFSGPWAAPLHSGELKVSDLTTPDLAPLALDLAWRAHALTIDQFHAGFAPENAFLTVNGSGVVSPRLGRFTLSSAKLEGAGQTYSLAHPSAILVQRTATNGHWRIEAQPLQLHTSTSDLTVGGTLEWPYDGRLSLGASNISFAPFQQFLKLPLPEVDLAQVRSSLQWSNGPVHFSLEGKAQFDPIKNTSLAITNLPFTAEIDATGDEHGVAVRKLVVAATDTPILSAHGSMPMVIEPERGADLVQLKLDEPLQFQGATRPNPKFWSALTSQARITLDAPALDLIVAGTLRDPTGTLKVAAKGIDFNVTTNLPRVNVRNISGDFAISTRQIQVKQFQALLEGQRFIASGDLPLPHDVQKDWRQIFNWRKISARIQGTNIQIAAFTHFAPKTLTPAGTLDLDLAATNGHLSGELIVTNAVSEPLLQVGSLQSLNANIQLDDQKIHIVRCAGLVGGGPVSIKGEIDLGRKEPVTKLPYFELTATGDNVPLSRTAQLIMRAGFALKVSNQKGGQPITDGKITLQDSYYLSDPKLLVPARLATAENRPPYFSIETPPFAHWRLDVAVAGNKFLQVHSPFFDGVVSANFHLTGTLGAPLALGDVTINSGQIEFPFANLNVTQGNVFLTAANPYLPQLYITANARAYTYDLHMQVSGPADQPAFEFTSTPGLSSDQILLMLTTGELPVTTMAFSTEQRASRIGVFVGKNTLSQLGLFPGGEERLTVGSGEAFGELVFPEEVMETYSAEYKLSHRWSLIGEYDPFGVNIGLKWLFYSR